MKAYIYCTQTKPFLYEGDTDKGPRYFSDNKDYKNDNPKLNGSIVAECDVNEAFFLKGFDGVKYAENPLMHEHETLGHHHCLTEDEIASYGQGKTLYCYHLENVKPVELKLSDFYEDEACTKPLTKAPQSYRFAYRKEYLNLDKESVFQANAGEDTLIDIDGKQVFRDEKRFDETGEDSYYRIIKVLIFSDHAQYCAKMLNGEKDLEVRKTRIAEGVEYK